MIVSCCCIGDSPQAFARHFTPCTYKAARQQGNLHALLPFDLGLIDTHTCVVLLTAVRKGLQQLWRHGVAAVHARMHAFEILQY